MGSDHFAVQTILELKDKQRKKQLDMIRNLRKDMLRNCGTLSMVDWIYKKGMYTSVWDAEVTLKTKPQFGWVLEV